MAYDVEHLFIRLLAIWISSLMRFVAHLKNQVVFLLSFKTSLCILDDGPLSDVFCKYCLPACGLACHSLDNAFHRAKIFNFN